MDNRRPSNLDIQALLHPSAAFRHPSDVVADSDLTLGEKRSILASWASDACAVEAYPALRRAGAGPVVSYDEIIDALQSLDAEQPVSASLDRITRHERKRRFAAWKDRRSGGRSANDGLE